MDDDDDADMVLDLVWAGISENLSTLVSTWWENQLVVDRLNALRRVGLKVFTGWGFMRVAEILCRHCLCLWLRNWALSTVWMTLLTRRCCVLLPFLVQRLRMIQGEEEEDASMIFQPQLICGECSVIAELQGRFNYFMKTGDDSRIPADLQSVTFRTVRAGSHD